VGSGSGKILADFGSPLAPFLARFYPFLSGFLICIRQKHNAAQRRTTAGYLAEYK
jgi:hypothetical protein